ncbi:MAG: hypothetical protein K6T86_13000 [Pirellulales bacterium]|nr:hypothetical protein [Pirellulales bacterium]
MFADFSIAPVMRFRHGKATGKLSPPAILRHPHGCPTHAQCLRNVLAHMSDRMGIAPAQVLAVAATENACCLLQAAGISVAYRPLHETVAHAAAHVICHSLAELLPMAGAVCSVGGLPADAPQAAV